MRPIVPVSVRCFPQLTSSLLNGSEGGRIEYPIHLLLAGVLRLEQVTLRKEVFVNIGHLIVPHALGIERPLLSALHVLN